MEKKEINYLETSKHLPFRIYTPREVATMLRCSLQYVYKLTSQGILKPIKTRCSKGKQQKFTKSFFTDKDIIEAYKYRFNLKNEELKMLERLQKGKGAK